MNSNFQIIVQIQSNMKLKMKNKLVKCFISQNKWNKNKKFNNFSLRVQISIVSSQKQEKDSNFQMEPQKCNNKSIKTKKIKILLNH